MHAVKDDTAPQHRRPLRKVVRAKMASGLTRTKQLGVKAWRLVRKIVVFGAEKATWLVFGALAVIGRVVFGIGQWLTALVVFLVGLVVGLGLVLLSGTAWLAVHGLNLAWIAFLVVIFAGFKVLYLISLIVSSPWLAYRGSAEALKTDWSIFLTGLRPSNWFVMDPTELARLDALRSMERRVKRETREAYGPTSQQQPRATAAATDGQSPSSPRRGYTEPKGKPTARQRVRRPIKLHPSDVPV